MNPSLKPFIAAAALLALLLGATVGVKLWRAPGAKEDITAPLAAACNLHAGPCTSTIPGGGTVTLAIEPRPVPVLRPLQVTVTVDGMEAQGVVVDFSGTAMDMGENRPALKRETDGTFRGQTVLPVCVTGSMEWQATVQVATNRGRVAAPFRFVTSRP